MNARSAPTFRSRARPVSRPASCSEGRKNTGQTSSALVNADFMVTGLARKCLDFGGTQTTGTAPRSSWARASSTSPRTSASPRPALAASHWGLVIEVAPNTDIRIDDARTRESANREAGALFRIAGDNVRVLLRLDLSGSPSHRELLARAEKIVAESRTHSRVPSGLVLAGEGSPRLLRSFCALNFLPPLAKSEASSGLRSPYYLPIWPGFPDSHRLFSDIIVYLVPTPQGPDFIVGANVSPASAARLAATFASSLESVLAALDATS